MLLDDLPAHAQPQAAAAVAVLVRLLGAVERLEDHPQLVRRDAHAAVGDLDLGHLRRLVLADLDQQSAPARHRLAGVDDQVEQDLLDLAADHGHLGPVVVFLLDVDLVLAQVLVGQDQHFLDQLDQVGQLAQHAVVAGEAEHAVDDGGGPLAALEDLLQGLEPARLVAVGPQAELGVVDEGGQDVVELVRDTGGERADAAEALGPQELFAQVFGLLLGSDDVLADHGSPPGR